MQARSVPGNLLIGQFTVSDARIQQTLDCDAVGPANAVRNAPDGLVC